MKVAVAFIAIGFYTFAQTMAEVGQWQMGQAQAIVEGQAASACRSQMELAVEPAVAEVAVGEVVGLIKLPLKQLVGGQCKNLAGNSMHMVSFGQFML